MIQKEDIQKLAELARITLSSSELEKLQEEIGSILSYVGEVQKVSGKGEKNEVSEEENVNVLREDAEPHEPGYLTEELISAAPEHEENYIKVKKILTEM